MNKRKRWTSARVTAVLHQHQVPELVPTMVVRQCTLLLHRLRQTIPFPISSKLVTSELLPRWMATMTEEPDEDSRLENLRLSMVWGDTINVALETAPVWRSMIAGSIPLDRVFWLTLSHPVPVAMSMAQPFRLPEDVAYYAQIEEWWLQATRLQSDIDYTMAFITEVVQKLDSAALIRHVWPELLNFVKLKGPTMMHIPQEHIARARRSTWDMLGPKGSKAVVTDRLATAVLIEAEPLNAWVSFKT
jgi:hypothetical protein